MGRVARARITDGGGGLCLSHSGIWTLPHCNAKPQDALSAGKRHNQNADENDGCGILVSDAWWARLVTRRQGTLWRDDSNYPGRDDDPPPPLKSAGGE